jgi:hypothetical protein
MGMSPRDVANIYASGISAVTDSVAKGTRMATIILFAGIEASRATTNYARHYSNEIARLTSILRGSLDRMQKIQLIGCKRADIVISQREKQYRLWAKLRGRLKAKKQTLPEENKHKRKTYQEAS